MAAFAASAFSYLTSNNAGAPKKFFLRLKLLILPYFAKCKYNSWEVEEGGIF
jgi:hypothetical protein